VPKAKGRLRGKQPKLTTKQGRHLLELIDAGTHSTAELAELFSVGRSTVYRTVRRLPHYQSSPRGRSLIPQSPDAEPATRIRGLRSCGGATAARAATGRFTGHRPTDPAGPEPSAVGRARSMPCSYRKYLIALSNWA
jgi:Helix-turn-helix domain of resolvase